MGKLDLHINDEKILTNLRTCEGISHGKLHVSGDLVNGGSEEYTFTQRIGDNKDLADSVFKQAVSLFGRCKEQTLPDVKLPKVVRLKFRRGGVSRVRYQLDLRTAKTQLAKFGRRRALWIAENSAKDENGNVKLVLPSFEKDSHMLLECIAGCKYVTPCGSRVEHKTLLNEALGGSVANGKASAAPRKVVEYAVQKLFSGPRCNEALHAMDVVQMLAIYPAMVPGT